MLVENVGRTLYHGTVIDHKASIEEHGLIPILGDFVSSSYGTEYDEETLEGVVFAADKEGIEGAAGAMRYHIGKKLGKWLTDVTEEDMRVHGMLVIIKDIEPPGQWDEPGETWTKAKSYEEMGWYESYPPSVEPGDWFLTSEMGSTIDLILTGRKMLKFLRRMGGLEHVETDKRRMIIKMAVAAHPDRSREEIVAAVVALDEAGVNRSYHHYREMFP
jgi:hypothetical protein